MDCDVQRGGGVLIFIIKVSIKGELVQLIIHWKQILGYQPVPNPKAFLPRGIFLE